jgi:very-short-patch-repair endonuclease
MNNNDMEEKHTRPAPRLWGKLRPIARQMRIEPTAAEQLLWQHLRNRQVLGCKFRRQHAIDRFVVDFFCKEAALVVEEDGAIHAMQQAEDAEREALLQEYGFTVLRFSNEQVLSHLDEVLSVIGQFVSDRGSRISDHRPTA